MRTRCFVYTFSYIPYFITFYYHIDWNLNINNITITQTVRLLFLLSSCICENYLTDKVIGSGVHCTREEKKNRSVSFSPVWLIEAPRSRATGNARAGFNEVKAKGGLSTRGGKSSYNIMDCSALIQSSPSLRLSTSCRWWPPCSLNIIVYS